MNASFHVATPIIFKKAAISSVNIFAFQVFYFDDGIKILNNINAFIDIL